MPVHLLYRIPFAGDLIRLVLGGFCLIFVLAILGSWLPRAIRWLFGLPNKSAFRVASRTALAMIPLAIAVAPAVILIALIRNPITYVFETGVRKESVFSQTPVGFAWDDIAYVSCGAGRGSGPRWFSLISRDGRKITFGNPGGMEFRSLHVLLEDRLGPVVMQGCYKAPRTGQMGRPPEPK